YRPVQNISFIFDYFFWNTDEFGFHLTNVLLHAACGIVLYFLLRRLFASFIFARVVQTGVATRSNWISVCAFLVALLWVAHPVHSAAVDYISGRADSLAFLFAAAGWLLFLCGRRAAHRFLGVCFYLGAAVSGMLALCSREIALVWVALFIAHVLLVDKTTLPRTRAWAVLSCIVLLFIYTGLRQLPGRRPVSPSTDGWSAPVRAVLMVRALGDYTRLMVFPSSLHMERSIFNPLTCRNNSDWRNGIGIEYLSVL